MPEPIYTVPDPTFGCIGHREAGFFSSFAWSPSDRDAAEEGGSDGSLTRVGKERAE
jgi:hypothetical protein